MKKKPHSKIKGLVKRAFSGAGILAACSVGAKLLGAMFRVPLTNIVGAEGMGLYQMVFPLYTVLLTLTSGGLAGAISKLVAQRAARGDKRGCKKIVAAAVVSVMCVAGIAAAVLVFFREKIATVQGNKGAALAYAGIAPAIVFVSLISCFRGYFQGLNNMLHSGLSQLIEQLVKLVVGLFLASALLPYGINYAVFGALLGISASEIAAFLYLLANYGIAYLRSRKKSLLSTRRLNRLVSSEAALEVGTQYFYAPDMAFGQSGEVVKQLYKIALPITLGSLIMPLTQVIDSVMVINLLAFKGVVRADATALFGLVNGPISSLINMPLVLTLALSVSLLPKIAQKIEGENARQRVNALTRSGIGLCLIFSLPCMGVFLFFGKQALQVLYSSGLNANQLALGATLLKIESLTVVFVGLIQVSTSVLQGAGMASRPAINLLYGAVVKVLLTLLLLPLLGIAGAAIASVCCYALTALLDLFALKKLALPPTAHQGIFLRLKPLFMPIFATIIFIAIAKTLFIFLALPLILSLSISLFAGAAAYFALLFATKTLKFTIL